MILAGPDGTGKSSVVTWSMSELAPQPVAYIWQRPGILPRRSPEGTGDSTQPHAASTYGAVVSWMKLLYVFIDFQVGWLFRIRPHARAGGITMIDRGWWDMAVDPRRYRMKVPERAIELLGRLIPAPDLVVVLHAPTDVILARKGDLPAEEIERQIERWKQVLPPRISATWIDAAQPLEAVARSVADAMKSRGMVA